MPNSHQLRDHQKQETNPGIFFQSVSNNNGNSHVNLTETNQHTGTNRNLMSYHRDTKMAEVWWAWLMDMSYFAPDSRLFFSGSGFRYVKSNCFQECRDKGRPLNHATPKFASKKDFPARHGWWHRRLVRQKMNPRCKCWFFCCCCRCRRRRQIKTHINPVSSHESSHGLQIGCSLPVG